jgi:hypothetical protein
MNQTAVDFIKLKLEEYGDPYMCQITWEEFDSIIEQAKEMEKQQIGYTKEDILLAGKLGEINHHDTKHIVSWIDEAKEINKKNIDKVLKIY